MQESLYRSGCIPSLLVPRIPGKYTGIQFGPDWSMGLDFEGEDLVLANTNLTDAPFNDSGDILRLSRNRRVVYGPSIGTPKAMPGTFNISVNPDTKVGLRISPWLERPVAIDAIDLRQSSDADRRFIAFGQGSGAADFRVGYVKGDLCFFNAAGTKADADSPGELIMKLDSSGNLWIKGEIRRL